MSRIKYPRTLIHLFVLLLLCVTFCRLTSAQTPDTELGDKLRHEFFTRETAKVTRKSLSEIETLEDWTAKRKVYHQQLQEMLGLLPTPERTPLHPVITGTHQREGVIVENIFFQSMPGFYVTANFYRPVEQKGPLPAILYVCGHGGVKKNGISYGNKTHYQHHGIWFARNGYVCLTIDTVQLGELEGIHHGTYREGMWWWHNRGYTSAGAEAWNGIRALDYLETRKEVDADRMGITGRSGGGAYSWWVAALDERIKVAVPVAGITSMHNHIVDGCIEGHCDCMYMVNTYGWDFPLLASLVAPRPLLISNTDKDRIFPLDGVVDVYVKTRRIYELHNQLDHIGLNIAEGPHKDTQELRVNAFHWFNRFLKNEDPLIETTAVKLFDPEELKVFDQLPDEERTTSIHETFNTKSNSLPRSQSELSQRLQDVTRNLKEKSFRNIDPHVLTITPQGNWQGTTATLSVQSISTDAVYDIPALKLQKNSGTVNSARIVVCDEQLWQQVSADLQYGVNKTEEWEKSNTANAFINGLDDVVYYFAPRGVGPTAWSGNERKQVQIKRRFALLGHTLDSVRTHDVIQCLSACMSDLKGAKRTLQASGEAANWALIAALLGPQVDELQLADLNCDLREGPYLLQVSQFTNKRELALLTAGRIGAITIHATAEEAECWRQIQHIASHLNWVDGKLKVVTEK